MTIHTIIPTIWTAAPRGMEPELFESEDRAYDCAFDWSIELGGAPVVIYCNGQPWTEVTA